jgi:hypothetical protein
MNEKTLEDVNLNAILGRAKVIGGFYWEDVNTLIYEVQRLRDEREKNKTVNIDWDSRPWATEVRIAYCRKDMPPDRIGDRIVTITRPKTIEQEIAESVAAKFLENDGFVTTSKEGLKQTILEAFDKIKDRTK